MEIGNSENLKKIQPWLDKFIKGRHMILDLNNLPEGTVGMPTEDGKEIYGPNGELAVCPFEFRPVNGILNSSHPAGKIPSLYCPFELFEEELLFNSSDIDCTAYEVYEWLCFINEFILIPNEMYLKDEELDVCGEEYDDIGRILVKDKAVSFEEGITVYSVRDIPTEVLEKELARRKEAGEC